MNAKEYLQEEIKKCKTLNEVERIDTKPLRNEEDIGDPDLQIIYTHVEGYLYKVIGLTVLHYTPPLWCTETWAEIKKQNIYLDFPNEIAFFEMNKIDD